MLALAGCNSNTDEPGGNKNGNDTVFVPGDTVYIISDGSGTYQEEIFDAMFDFVLKGRGGRLFTGAPGDPVHDLEIIINVEDDTRPIVQKARKILEREDEPAGIFEMRYVIYASGGQVVIVTDENVYTKHQAVDYIVSDFVEKYILGKDEIVFKQGVVENSVIDLVTAQEAEDAVYLEEKWVAFDEEIKKIYGESNGAEITKAFRTYYSMFSDKVVTWWADLYDPGIGGFYYTNSGRNNYGYLPGIESTGQILSHLVSTGMLETLGGSLSINLPQLMQYQIAYYYKSLQDPDGLFYNPQLGKEGSTSYRLGRDQGHAISRMTQFGAWPTYTCVYSGKTYEGDGITADEWWDGLVAEGLISADTPRPYVPKSLKDYEDYVKKGNLSATSAKEAVSKVVATSSQVIATSGVSTYFKSHSEFEVWLKQWNPDTSPYAACSNISAARNLIEPSSAALGDANAPGKWYHGMTLTEMTVEYLNGFINDRGLFGAYVDNGDPSAGCKFQNTNGLMKAISVYNNAGVAYPEPLKAVESCLIGIMSDEVSSGNVCEVYNIWTALSGVLTNVKNYGTKDQIKFLFGYYDEGKGAQVEGRIYQALGRDGAAAIINSYEKQKNYQCSDGGFNHSVNGNAAGGSNNGGVPAGIGSVKESNVDAVGFGMQSIISVMRSSFGLKTSVPVFTESDWMRFIGRVVELNPVIKDSIVNNIPKVYNFSNYEKESIDLPEGMKIVGNSDLFGDYSQVGEKGMDGKAGVLQINKLNGKSTSLSIESPVNVATAGCNILTWEMDIKYSNVSTKVESQVQLATKNQAMKDRPFMIILTSASGADGTPIRYQEYRSDGGDKVNPFDTPAVIGEWFKLKIVYYEGDGETYRYKVYINDELIYTSNALYSALMAADTTTITPAAELAKMSFSLNEAFGGTLEVDNIRLVQGVGTLDDLKIGRPGQEIMPADRPDPELPPPPIPGGITTPAAKDAINYDNDVDKKFQTTSSSIVLNKFYRTVDLSGNNVLYVDKAYGANDNASMSVVQYTTKSELDATLLVYEVDLYTSYTAKGVLQISMNGSGTTGTANSPVLIILEPDAISNGSTIRYADYAYDPAKEASASTGKIATDAKVGEWFRLRIEYKIAGTDALGNRTIEYSTYINNKLIKTCTHIYSKNVYTGATPLPTVESMNSLTFSFNAANAGDFVMDNASFRKIVNSDYTDAEIVSQKMTIGSGVTAPAGALTFDRYLEYMVSSDTVKIENPSSQNKVEIVQVSGDRMMSLKKNDSKTVGFIHCFKRDAVVEPSVVTYSTLMKLLTDANSGEFVISFVDSTGAVGAKVALLTDANGNVVAKAYKSTSAGDFDSGIIAPKTAVKADEFFELTVVYSMGKKDNCLKVLINDTLVLQGNYYIGVKDVNAVTDAHISDVDGVSMKLEGAIIGEAILDYTHFTTEPLPKDFVAENTNNGVIELDKDFSKSLTVSVSDKFADKNTWEIVEEEDGNKVMAIHKTVRDTVGSSSGVTLSLSVTKNEVDANKMIFEGRFKFTDLTAADVLQIAVNSTGTTPFLGAIAPMGTADGSKIENHTYHYTSKGTKYVTPAKVGEWFDLKIEYWVTEEDSLGNPTAVRYQFTVNGVATGGTVLYKGYAPLKISDIKKLNLSFNNANIGEYFVDDLSLRLEYADLSLEPDVEGTHAHKYVDGFCECGEKEPHVHKYTDGWCECGAVEPHDHSYTEGKCWCGASDPNYVPPLKDGVLTFSEPYTYYFKSSDNAYATYTVGTDENGNDYCQVVKTAGGVNTFKLYKTYEEEGATVAEVTFDIWISTDTNINTQFFFTVNDATSKSSPYRWAPFLYTVNSLSKGVWHTVKIVYKPTAFMAKDSKDEFAAEIYFDGVLNKTITDNYSIGKENANIPTLSELSCFSFGLNNSCNGTFRFDNASFKLLKEASK